MREDEEFDPLIDAAENGYKDSVEKALDKSKRGYYWQRGGGTYFPRVDLNHLYQVDCSASVDSMVDVKPLFKI